jgi:anti-sigma factor RsiW
MDCELIRLDLVGFHFGDLDDEPRRTVEAHLPSCTACLQAFLALKRSVETSEARPSAAARARLRAAIAEQVAPQRPPAWSWWQRPLAVAVAAAAVFFAASTVRVLASSPGGAPQAWSRPDQRALP